MLIDHTLMKKLGVEKKKKKKKRRAVQWNCIYITGNILITIDGNHWIKIWLIFTLNIVVVVYLLDWCKNNCSF